jgi:hypothetical protein
MAVAGVNLTIEKATDFSIAFKIKTDGSSINLAGYGYSCVMKKHYGSTVGYGFSVTPLSPLSNGVVRLQMHKSITSNIPVGRYVYDLLIVNPEGDTYKSTEGMVLVKGTSS